MVRRKNYLTTLVVAFLISVLFVSVSCGTAEKDTNNSKKEAQKYFERGLAYYKLGKVDKAITEYENAVAYDKEHKEAHYNLAVLYREKGRFTDAIREFEAYITNANPEADKNVIKYASEEIAKLKEKNK